MILKRMKRRHTREQIVEFCNKMRKILPDASFGADMIAGFPTETEIMFNNSLNLISETGIQYLHVFPYSERENTPASKMPQVQKHIRKKRAQLLRNEGQKQLQLFFQQQIGKIVKVLVEKKQFGHSENFIPTYIATRQTIGEIVNVKLTGIDNDHMTGTVVN